MSLISQRLPAWAHSRVSQFLEARTSPLEGAKATPVSAGDAQAHVALIQDLADKMIASDQSAQDTDARPGVIKKPVFKSGLTEDIQYSKDSLGVELAYDFGEGHHAQYLVNNDERAVLVDISQSEHSYNLAVLIDKRNPANSLLFSQET